MKKFQNKILIFIQIFLLLVFVLIATLVTINRTSRFDEFIFQLLPHHETLTSIISFLTNLGSTGILAFLSIILFLIIKDKRKSILFPLNLFLIGSLNHFLKFIFQRERPIGKLVEASGYSFPSGHSAASLAFYGLLIYFIYKFCPNKTLKITSITLLSLLIIAIGLSRICLHVHYPTDVLGGFTYSLFYLIIFIKFSEKYILKK